VEQQQQQQGPRPQGQRIGNVDCARRMLDKDPGTPTFGNSNEQRIPQIQTSENISSCQPWES